MITFVKSEDTVKTSHFVKMANALRNIRLGYCYYYFFLLFCFINLNIKYK